MSMTTRDTLISNIIDEIERQIKSDLQEGGISDLRLSPRDMCRMEWEEIREELDKRWSKS